MQSCFTWRPHAGAARRCFRGLGSHKNIESFDWVGARERVDLTTLSVGEEKLLKRSEPSASSI
jgi:hypothetical protein